MIRNLTMQVDTAEAGLRLDRFLALRVPNASRTMILEALTEGHIRVEGRRAAKGRKMLPGEVVNVEQLQETSDRTVLADPSVALDIVYEDADLIVLNKPAGMAVHPLKSDETGTLANGLLARHPSLAEIGSDPLFPALIHRIDTDTSGLVIAAKTQSAYAHLRQQFREQRVTKIYTALVHGAITESGTLEGYLTHQDGPYCKMQVLKDFADPSRADTFKAITHYKPIRQFPKFTLLEIDIPTGVTHQIRCQLADAGYPIVGDRVYGKRTPIDQAAPRHFLHAEKLELRHPTSLRIVAFQAPLPPDLTALLRLEML
ncbi:MAG TPA: RluA family pseudouridine synthase [Verrucomicrobia bacterium]|nr:MAG: hypothetical protein A2X46_03970 [Lentisphaerae bacterium GWF2_57_35]HBA82499.1 RluA family pseudouridine synthase [Verrucomicrobiota bacterium]